MTNDFSEVKQGVEVGGEEVVYESPRVESVLTPEEMEREILYAGSGGTSIVN